MVSATLTEPASSRVRHAHHRSAGSSVAATRCAGNTRRCRRCSVGHGCQDRTQVPPARPAPHRGTDASHVAYSPGPVRRRLGRRRRAVGPQPGAGGVDPVPPTPAGTPRTVPGRPTPHLPAAGQDVAGHARSGEGSVLRPGPHARPAVCLRLHPHDRPAGDHRRPAVRPPDLPLRPDVLELGDRHGVLRRVVRDARRRVAERARGTGRGARRPPHRPAHGRHPAGHDGRGVHPAVSGVAEALRPGRAGDSSRARERERGHRAAAPAVQAGPRPAVDAPQQPGLPEPRVVPGLPPGSVRPVEREPWGEEDPGDGTPACAAGGSVRVGRPRRGEGGRGQHDPRPGEHVLGVEPADRRAGRGATARRARGGVVRAEDGGTDASPARSRPAPDRVPARDRLAGPQAGCVRGVPLPRGLVPDDDVPHRLRRAALAGAAAGGPGVPAAAAPRGR